MILPILLISSEYINKHLYNPDAIGKQLGLIQKFRHFSNDLIQQFWNTLILPTYPSEINNLHFAKWGNKNLLLMSNNKYAYVLACNEQNNQQWFENMSSAQKQETLKQLRSEYREILIDYFVSDQKLKVKIDKFINDLFYANIPVLQIIEIHMELIDEFSKQLKLEGRSDETLLDYRLTLIDILANLCEVYRCSGSKINQN